MRVFRQSGSLGRSWGRVGRVLLVLLILTSFAAVQAASAIEILPDHHGSDDRCCDGGHAGHFPVLVSVNIVPIATLCRLVHGVRGGGLHLRRWPRLLFFKS